MAQTISPQTAAKLIDEQGALLIDTRETDEFREVRIPGTLLQPLSVLEILPPDPEPGKPAIYFCARGRRTGEAPAKLEKRGHAVTYIMNGGLAAWEQAGLPVKRNHAPLSLMRQTFIAAGSLFLFLSLLTAYLPFFGLVIALMGAGLLVSGLTGFCGLAWLMTRMPWNSKRAQAAQRPLP